jgi:hypothetical protein
MSGHLNTISNHSLIANANQYIMNKQYISISSNDRDVIKYPSSSEFEIELPRDYTNIVSCRLYSATFPVFTNTFSEIANNVTLMFKFDKLYNPSDFGFANSDAIDVYTALSHSINHKIFTITIESGVYTNEHMAVELTNKMNQVVTRHIHEFIETNNYSSSFTSYNRFVVKFNEVNQRIWFGNKADKFTLTNNIIALANKTTFIPTCSRRTILPEVSNWGLPYNLGFTDADATAQNTTEIDADLTNGGAKSFYAASIAPSIDWRLKIPYFYYDKDPDTAGWLIPEFPGAVVYFLRAPAIINLVGPTHFYIEVDGLNCIDETSPFNISKFTSTTNQTNGVVNAAFSKIMFPSNNTEPRFIISDSYTIPFKYFSPPA